MSSRSAGFLPFISGLSLTGFLLLFNPIEVHAERADITSSADTTLVEAAPESNLGGACIVNSGTTKISTRNRGLFLFDLTGSIPANAIITSVELILGVTGEPNGGFIASSYTLHRMLVPWGEGNKGDPNCPPDIGSMPGLGDVAGPGEANWTHRFAQTPQTWGSPGGEAGADFVAGASADQLILGTGESPYHFFDTPELRADVQSWLNDPQGNYGWMLICDAEGEDGTARRFASREDPFNPPILVVDFTIVPEPRTVSLLGLVSLILLLVHRRRA